MKLEPHNNFVGYPGLIMAKKLVIVKDSMLLRSLIAWNRPPHTYKRVRTWIKFSSVKLHS